MRDDDWLSQLDPNGEWRAPKFEPDNPTFDQVEIQIVSWCNRSCAFCPSGKFPVDKEMMSLRTVDNIIAHLEPRNFAGTVGLHLMCEPLLHKKVGEIIDAFRTRLPQTYIRIESNGDVLDKEFGRLSELFESGLNEILVNCYDSRAQFDTRNGAILALASRDPEIWYWNQRMAWPKTARSDWRVVRLRAFYEDNYALRNWAGHVGLQRPERISFPIPLSCARPFRRLHVNYRGEVVLCNNDWKHEVVVGDLNTESLDDVWNAPLLSDYRRRLLEKDRDMRLCRTCDNGVPSSNPPRLPPADSWAAGRQFWSNAKKRFTERASNLFGGRSSATR